MVATSTIATQVKNQVFAARLLELISLFVQPFPSRNYTGTGWQTEQVSIGINLLAMCLL